MTGGGAARRLSPHEALGTVLCPPSMRTYPDIPFCHVKRNSGVRFSRKKGKDDTRGLVATAIIRYRGRTSKGGVGIVFIKF